MSLQLFLIRGNDVISETPNVGTTGKMPKRDPKLWAAATALEATFLAEMMKAAKIGAPRDTFGGGIGEEQFSTLLVDEYARGLAGRTDTGLSEAIYRGLVSKGSRE